MTLLGGLDHWTNSAQTTLNGAINSAVTSIVVTSALPFPSNSTEFFRILIDNEIMLVTGGQSTTTWTVVRGVEGTAPASHSNLAAITHDLSAWELNSFRQEFNVKAYSAVGNGVADESTAFQNAINDAHAQSVGGVVFLPPLNFKVVTNPLTTYSNVLFVSYGSVLSGAGAASVAPLVKWGLTGTLTLPAALTVQAGGASITGGLTVASGGISVTGTTTLGGVAYTWPGTAGTSGYFLQTNGAGTLSWQPVVGGVTSVTGTANHITASPTTGAVVLDLPSSGTLPGSWTAATGFTVTTGGLTVSAGGANITGGITGTLNTAAQPNITSLGTLTVLSLNQNNSNTVPTLASANGAQIFINSAAPLNTQGNNGDVYIQG